MLAICWKIKIIWRFGHLWPGADLSDYIEISREMGTNHRDLLRLLPRSVPDAIITSTGDEKSGASVVVENAPYGRIEIDLSKVGERRIALLCLPVTHVISLLISPAPLR